MSERDVRSDFERAVTIPAGEDRVRSAFRAAHPVAPADVHDLEEYRPGRRRRPRATGDGGSGSGGNGGDRTIGDDPRPLVRIVAGDLRRVVDELEAALVASPSGLYQRAGLICRAVLAEVPTADGGAARAFRIIPAPAANIAECLTAAARIEKFDKRTEAWVPTDCPARVAETLLARGKWRLAPLVGVISTPTLRPDGSLLDSAGYDAATGLLFEPGGEKFPRLRSRPSRDHAVRALTCLRDLLKEFPFVSPADEAVAISGVLTALIRRSIPAAPLHGYTAPVAGSGKSLLVDIAATIATGRAAAVLSQSRSDEENEKRLGAALIAGDSVVSFDNVEHPLGGGLLCQALTQSEVKIRVLGLSTNADVPSGAAIYATGNNLVLAGDMTRRALLCSLDPCEERPELRVFRADPLAKLRGERGRYVAAGLTLLRAYHVAGRPAGSPPVGSFTDWCRWVRDALTWLGMPDPCETMEKTRSVDPKLSALLTIIEQWLKVIGEHRVQTRDLIQKANETVWAPTGDRYVAQDLRDALLIVAADGREISARRLGKWLLANAGRVVNGKRIVQDGILKGIMTWRVELVERGP